jgi:hypothetical protein
MMGAHKRTASLADSLITDGSGEQSSTHPDGVKSGKYDRVVRCKQGHVYTTVWVPLASLKALRFGSWRYQHCPVGQHWSMTSRVKDLDALTAEEKRSARKWHDNAIF